MSHSGSDSLQKWEWLSHPVQAESRAKNGMNRCPQLTATKVVPTATTLVT